MLKRENMRIDYDYGFITDDQIREAGSYIGACRESPICPFCGGYKSAGSICCMDCFNVLASLLGDVFLKGDVRF